MSVINPTQVVTTVMGKPVTYSQTVQGKGYVYENGYFTMPERAPSGIWDTVGNIIKTGVDIYKGVVQAKTSERIPIIPSQNAVYPVINSLPEKQVVGYQEQGSIFDNIFGAVRTVAQAPELMSRTEQISKQAQLTGWVIFGGLIFVGVILLAKR